MNLFNKLQEISKETNLSIHRGQHTNDGDWLPNPTDTKITNDTLEVSTEFLSRGEWMADTVTFTKESVNNPIKVLKNWIQLNDVDGNKRILSVFKQVTKNSNLNAVKL